MKIVQLLLAVFFAQNLLGQVTFVEPNLAAEFKKSNETTLVLATENPKTIAKLAKKKGADYPAMYRQMVADYNAMLKEVFAADWRSGKLHYMTRAELAAHAKDQNLGNWWFIATSFADETLADAALQLARKKKTEFNLSDFLVAHDDQSSLDICPGSQFEQYFLPKKDWDAKQAKRMENEKQLGKPAPPGDFLRHRRLQFAGFFLSQHSLLTRGDLRFALPYLQADLEKAAANPKKAEVNQKPKLTVGQLAKTTLLVGRDLTIFPNGKTNLSLAEVQKIYPKAVQLVEQQEIEKALAEKRAGTAVVIPAVRWAATGYPELLVFWVVNAADGKTIFTFADTGSGSNPTTANNFEKNADLKAKHFQEFLNNSEE